MLQEKVPKISVITPVYNGAAFIAETVESVIQAKKFFEIEYIVINDGSTDMTRYILDSYKNEITIVDVINGGEAAAVNIGINLAKAPLLMVVSADDPIREHSIFGESLMEHERNPSLAATYVDWAVIDESGRTIRIKQTKNYSLQELIGFTNCLPGPGAVFKTKFAREVSGRNSVYRFVSDYDFWLRLSTKGPFCRIPKVLAQWRAHPGSTTVSEGGDQMAFERVRVIESFLSDFDLPVKLQKQAISHAYYYAARLSLDFKISQPRKLLIKSFVLRGRWPEKANLIVALAIFLNPFPREVVRLTKKVSNFLASQARMK